MATAQSASTKWGKNLKAAGQFIKEGVQSTDKNPMVRAAEQKDKYLARVTESVNNGTYEARLRAVPMERWRDNTINKGIPRISQGVDSAMSKMEDFFSELLPFQERLSERIEAMPDTTLDDSINRMVEFTRGMSTFRRGARR